MNDKFEIKPGHIDGSSQDSLCRMWERDGYRVTDLTPILRAPDGVKWILRCDTLTGSQMVVRGLVGAAEAVRGGLAVTHTAGDLWEAVTIAKAKRIAEPKPQPEPESNQVFDPDSFVIPWDRQTARQRARDAIAWLRTWRVLTPDEQTVLLNRAKVMEKFYD